LRVWRVLFIVESNQREFLIPCLDGYDMVARR
jgi:hypothetical protein